MYHPASIAPLSQSQISKALKGLPVRVSVGNHHDVELSADQFKKFSKAGQKGKALTIAMDPYQIQNHMHLMGAGKLKKSIRADAARLITSGTDRAIQAISGSGKLKKSIRADAARLITSGTDRAIQAISGSGKLKKSIRANAARLITSGTDRAIRAIEGGSVNHLKKAQRWEHFANATIRDGIDTAGKAARVYNKSTDPMSMMGFGVKKRGRPRKHGGALMAAGM